MRRIGSSHSSRFAAHLSIANLSHLNFTVLFAFAAMLSRICTHIASVLKPAIGVACPLMCMYNSHTKKCGGNAPMIVFPFPANVSPCRMTASLLRVQ
jgi:hypothetical protein